MTGVRGRRAALWREHGRRDGDDGGRRAHGGDAVVGVRRGVGDDLTSSLGPSGPEAATTVTARVPAGAWRV